MLLFALVLEQLAHGAILSSPAGLKIQGSFRLSALYGGVMAGLFEETGRFLAMRFILKKDHKNIANAIMYGVEHGGFEMMVLLVFGMANNLIYSLMLNFGMADILPAPLDEANRAVVRNAFTVLSQTNPLLFLASPAERIAAFIAQISMSVMVWFAAVKKGKAKYCFLAFALHFLIDAAAACLNGLGFSIPVIDLTIWVMAVFFAIIARSIWYK